MFMILYLKQMINASGDWLCGGDLEVLQRITWNDGLDKYRLTPSELQARFREMKVSKSFLSSHWLECVIVFHLLP